MVKYVPIKGGGVNLIAYITFLQKVWPTGVLSGVLEYAGASAGSIISGFMAAGYTPDLLYKILSTFDFKRLEDGNIFVSAEGILSERHGLHPGKWFENWADSMFTTALGKPKATFRDLKAAGRSGFTAVTTDLQSNKAFFCNYENTPDIILSEALRASMSIPLLFDLFSFTQGTDISKFYSDGGEALNYPITIFDGQPEDEVMGLYLHDVSDVQPPMQLNGFRSFVDAHFETLLDQCDSWVFPNEKWMRQTNIIDTGEMSATDFNISSKPANIAFLEQSGTNSGEDFIAKKLLTK
jgi:predicted acylesterase/phospholipase RssA